VAPRADHGQGVSGYPLRFGTAAFLLISVTLVLVLFVIPERYVLSPGFRESGMSFPAPTTPFVPVASVPVPATPLPALPGATGPGPAELLWVEVLPLLERGQLGAAVPVFEAYLAEHPGDRDVRRELAVTLLAADRPGEAVPLIRALLEEVPDTELRLLLARTLRDLRRVDEASVEYARLGAARPDDEALALEWAQAHAWIEEYEEAAAILTAALARRPGSVPLGVELARVYYAMGRLRDAVVLLIDLDPGEVTAAGGGELRASVLAAYFPMVPEVASAPGQPTPLERALAARFAGDHQRARTLLEAALAARPGDRELWLAYADLLEYELADFEEALRALLEADRLGAPDPALELRLAQLEVWTGRNAEAMERLDALLASLDAGAIGSAAVSRADVLALRGDLERWQGDRIRAARSYRLALAADPRSQRALDGLAALEAEVAQQLLELEAPGLSGLAYSLADSDDFLRFDAGGEWSDVAGVGWVWGGAAGQRWLGGFDLDGVDASRSGVFAGLEVARWWRWGTLRSGVDVGAERLRSSWDVLLGASLRHRGVGGRYTELRFDHGPAHSLASTLQSLLAEVVHERLSVTHTRTLGTRWSVSAVLEGARLRTLSGSTSGSDATDRLQLALAAGRAVNRSLTVGLATRALAFTEAAPLTGTGPAARALFWDPSGAFSAGPYASVAHEISTSWRLSGRLNPGLALIDERRPVGAGYDLVPHISAEAGVRHEGRLSTALELFYYQGQFDGYRSYGARVTVGARGSSEPGSSR
jgi:predicted Zn-dependent protease